MLDVTTKKWHLRHDDEIWTDDDEYVGMGDTTELANYMIALHNNRLDASSVRPTLVEVVNLPDAVISSDEEISLIVFGVKATKLRVGFPVENGIREQQIDFALVGQNIPVNKTPAYIAPLNENGDVLFIIIDPESKALFEDGEIKLDRLKKYLSFP